MNFICILPLVLYFIHLDNAYCFYLHYEIGTMNKTVILLATVSALTGTHALAAKDISGFYLGGGFGTTTYKDDIPNSMLEADGSSFKLIGGYQFNRIVGVEVQYTNYSGINLTDIDSDIIKSISVEPTAISIATNLGYTFNSGWRPFATIGLTQMSFNVPTKDKVALRLGTGVEYTPARLERLNFRIAYEVDTFNVEDLSSDDITVQLGTFYAGATYKF